jgi:hypothetical protein
MPHKMRNVLPRFSIAGISHQTAKPSPSHVPPKNRRLLSSSALAVFVHRLLLFFIADRVLNLYLNRGCGV